MEAESPVAGDHPAAINSRGRVALRWWSWGVVSAPPTVVLHEFGHFIVLWGLGLPGAALHYASANHSRSGAFTDAVLEGDFAAAAEIAPMWGAVMSVAMGLVATYVVVFACCCLCAKWKPHPLLVAMGLLSNFRISAVLLVLVLPLFGRTVEAGCDECWLERLTGIPLAVWALPGVISLVVAAWWLWRYFPREHRWVTVTAVVLGMGTGVATWAGFLGPLLLP